MNTTTTTTQKTPAATPAPAATTATDKLRMADAAVRHLLDAHVALTAALGLDHAATTAANRLYLTVRDQHRTVLQRAAKAEQAPAPVPVSQAPVANANQSPIVSGAIAHTVDRAMVEAALTGSFGDRIKAAKAAGLACKPDDRMLRNVLEQWLVTHPATPAPKVNVPAPPVATAPAPQATPVKAPAAPTGKAVTVHEEDGRAIVRFWNNGLEVGEQSMSPETVPAAMEKYVAMGFAVPTMGTPAPAAPKADAPKADKTPYATLQAQCKALGHSAKGSREELMERIASGQNVAMAANETPAAADLVRWFKGLSVADMAAVRDLYREVAGK